MHPNGGFADVQSKAGLAAFLIRPVAGVTVVGEDGTDVAVEAHLGGNCG